MDLERKGAASVMLGAAMWGCISIFVRQISAVGLDMAQTGALRSLAGALMMVAFLAVKDPSLLRIRLKDAWCFVGTGLVSLAFFNWCYFTTIQSCGASVAVVLLYTSPVFVMLFSALLFRERITVGKAIALVMTFGGSVLVAGLGAGGGGMSPWSFLIGIGSGVGYALYSIFGRYALERYDTLTVTAYTFLFSLIGLVPISRPSETVAVVAAHPGVLWWVLGIGLFCTVLPYLLYTWGLRRLETGRAAILATVEPLVGALVGILLFREAVTAVKLLGMALIFGAVLVLNRKG